MPFDDWESIFRRERTVPYFQKLQAFVAQERRTHEVFPPEDRVLAAFEKTPLAAVRVVILGQDPYHGPGQAHGLSFSVAPGVRVPPSLVNIYKELAADIGCARPSHGHLASWANQGVLLLNATLTVRAHTPASHQGQGWETFTDALLSAVSAKQERVVFILWGAMARKKRKLVDTSKHAIVESAHPSPLSAYAGFFGSKPFSATNRLLHDAGRAPIDWGSVSP